jgi:hypothetical protein
MEKALGHVVDGNPRSLTCDLPLPILGSQHLHIVITKQRVNGGRYKDRTCDPYDVNVVLYR